jgi:hypothetical protein
MTPNDKTRLMEVLKGVHDFYGKELTRFAGQVWMQACDSFDVEQVSKALSAHLMDPERGQFMPKPADLVRQLQGTKTDRSLIAWGKAYDAMQRVGAYTSVVFDDPVIHAVIADIGGWTTLCRTTTDELPFVQKRFCDSYRAYSGRPLVDFPAKLLGQSDMENQARGYEGARPILIGDASKAQEVLRLGSAGAKTEFTQLGDAAQVLQITRSNAA